MKYELIIILMELFTFDIGSTMCFFLFICLFLFAKAPVAELARQVLAEVPKQVTDYYKMMGIAPSVKPAAPNIGPGAPHMGPGAPNMGPGAPHMGPGAPNMGPGIPNMVPGAAGTVPSAPPF